VVTKTDALGALITSDARGRLLTAMFSAPDRRWYQRELARETGLPLTAVQRELRRLVAAGFLAESREAGRRLYAPDAKSSVFGELQAIVLKLRGPVPAIRDAVYAEHGVRLAWIFGSFAARTASVLSDIDIMVLGGVPVRKLRSRLIPVERRLARSINEHVMSAAEWRRRIAANDGFVREVRHGAKLWIIGDDASLTALDPQPKR
jgi:predicted nucleotidyltransferase